MTLSPFGSVRRSYGMFTDATSEGSGPTGVFARTGDAAARPSASAAARNIVFIGFPTPGESSRPSRQGRSEEHTSELPSLMRISYAVFFLKKKKVKQQTTVTT